MNYYSLYLKRYFKEEEDERFNDDDFINERAEAASGVYEECRLRGLTVAQAQEMAMASLMSDL